MGECQVEGIESAYHPLSPAEWSTSLTVTSPDYPNILGQACLAFQPMRMQGVIRVSHFKTNHKNSRWRTKREPRERCKLCVTFLRKVQTSRECSKSIKVLP